MLEATSVVWRLNMFRPEAAVRAWKYRAAAALFQFASTDVMPMAVMLCPVDTGALRGSAQVRPSIMKPNGDIELDIGFGNASVRYAVYVHEGVGKHFKVGQAKFLETAIAHFQPTMASSVAAIMRQGN